MWRSYPLLGEIKYLCLFWINLDIVFFMEVEKLIYIETLYCLAIKHFVGILTIRVV